MKKVFVEAIGFLNQMLKMDTGGFVLFGFEFVDSFVEDRVASFFEVLLLVDDKS